MKIAYLFSGHLRTHASNTTLKAMLFDVNPPGDVIIHTYATHNFSGHKWHGDDGKADLPVNVHDVRYLAE